MVICLHYFVLILNLPPVFITIIPDRPFISISRKLDVISEKNNTIYRGVQIWKCLLDVAI